AIRWNRLAMEFAEQSDQPRAGGWLGSLYNNLGWTYHDRGDFEQALELFERGAAWREAREPEEPKRIARWSVARALRSLGRTEEALARQQQLLEDYTAAGQRSGYVFEELAECHLLLGHGNEAREFFAEAWKELSQDEWLRTAEPDRLARLRELGGLAGVDGSASS
ncbi:MAG: tetratricopeptide repeat protein, partial [Planctomycetaceae bacterium]|nr:tetratricopeptide repeat protein [Planctomycetaceae bacterium]